MPFCRVTLQTAKPVAGYPKSINTLRDHLLSRILDLGIEKREAARRIGVRPQSLTNWLAERSGPELYLWTKVIGFLGYDPRPVPKNLGERLLRWRQERGLSQADMARALGRGPWNPGTLGASVQGAKQLPAQPNRKPHGHTPTDYADVPSRQAIIRRPPVMAPYRSAPPLLARTSGRAIDQLAAFFKGPDQKPIVGPEGRTASFARDIWTYNAFVKPFHLPGIGRPEQRFGWVLDTLKNPSGIWRQSGNPRPAEFLVSRYVFEQSQIVFVVKAVI